VFLEILKLFWQSPNFGSYKSTAFNERIVMYGRDSRGAKR